MKFLLQQQSRRGGTSDGGLGYANFSDGAGVTPLFRTIAGEEDVPHLISPKVVLLLIDAGAHTSSTVRVTNTRVHVIFNDTMLAFTNSCLCKKQARGGEDATGEQMYRLEAIRRLLLQVEAARATSWLWLREPLLVRRATPEFSTGTAAGNTAANGTQLASMLPILKRRRRGVALAPLLRWDEMCVTYVEVFSGKFFFYVKGNSRSIYSVTVYLTCLDVVFAKTAAAVCWCRCGCVRDSFPSLLMLSLRIECHYAASAVGMLSVRRHVCEGFVLLHRRTNSPCRGDRFLCWSHFHALNGRQERQLAVACPS